MISVLARATRAAVISFGVAGFSSPAAAFYTSGGHLYDASGSEVVLHGVSHTGFNNSILQPQYLWSMGWKEQIAQIKALGFNAVRLPLVPEVLYNTTPVDQLCYLEPTKNADLYGKTPLQVLDMWMAEADRQGLYVMINIYSVSKSGQYPTWFITNPNDYHLGPWNGAYTEANWIGDLTFLAKRYANLSHFIALDLYNEPVGSTRWSSGTDVGDPAYFWKRAAEAAGASILSANPNLLIFVEGIAGNYDGIEDSSVPTNWGEDLQPQHYQPLNIPGDKLVLSPHTYGPDVFWKSTFSSSSFPANLPADWDKLFGSLYPSSMLVVGEWGGNHGLGPSGATDTTWENAFSDYMISRGIASAFWWDYTPNALGTGGILDDNLQVRADKMQLLTGLWAATTPPPIVASGPTDSGSIPPPPVDTGSSGASGSSGSTSTGSDSGSTSTVDTGSGSSGSLPTDSGSASTFTGAPATAKAGALELPVLVALLMLFGWRRVVTPA